MGQNLGVANKVNDTFFPFFMQCVGRSRYLFVWAHTVETAHEDVSEFQGIQTMLDQAWCEFKSRIFLQTDHVDGDDRNIRVAGFGQCAADKSNVVGCTTATTGL